MSPSEFLLFKTNNLDEVVWTIIEPKFPNRISLKFFEIVVRIFFRLGIILQDEMIAFFDYPAFTHDDIVRSNLSQVDPTGTQTFADEETTYSITVGPDN